LAQGLVSQAIVPLNSQAIAAAVGTVTKEVLIALTGVGAQAAAGSVALGTRSATLTGVLATGGVGDVTAVYWRPVDDTQAANWQNVNSTQGVAWADVDSAQVPNWTLITT
jgi:hypothetical protein